MIKLYGIANCSTVKKARCWLQQQNLPVEFIDFKKSPPTKQDIQWWLSHISSEILINRRSSTWRKLSAAEQQACLSEDGAIKLMQAYPSIIKRPVLVFNQTVTIGFGEGDYSLLFTHLLKK